jgi:hypothetical protein
MKYATEMTLGDMKCAQSIKAISLGMKVILRSLPQQFERL